MTALGKINYESWGICQYRHCARPVPPPLKWCRHRIQDGGRDCYRKEFHLKKEDRVREAVLAEAKARSVGS